MFTSHLFAIDVSPSENEFPPLAVEKTVMVDQHTEIRIAITANIEPYVGTDAEGKPNGLLIDIWNLWSKKTGTPIVFIIGDSNSSLDFIRKGKADIHIGYPESQTLNSGLVRSQRIYQIKSRLFHFGEPISSLSKLTSMRIGAIATAPYLDKVKRVVPDAELKLYGSVAAMIEAAKAGHITSFIAASASTQHYLIEKEVVSEFYPFMGLTFITDLFVLCPDENDELSIRIKEGFTLITEEELTAIEQKWVVDANNWTLTNNMRTIEISAQEYTFLNALPPLKVGYVNNKQSTKLIDDKGHVLEGDSEVLQHIQDQLGINTEVVEYQQLSVLMADLSDGKIALAVDLTHIAESSTNLLFSDAYWPSPWAVVTPIEREPVAKIEQLTGQRVAIVDNDLWLIEFLKTQYDIRLTVVADTHAGVKAVSDDAVDAFIGKAADMPADLSQITLLADVHGLKSYVGVHSDKARLVPLINKILSDVKQKTRQEIYRYGMSANKQKKPSGFMMLVGLLVVLFATFFLLSREFIKRKQLESKFQQLSNYDTLTSLPNRSLLDDRLEQAVLCHCRELASFAVLFIEFGGMKSIHTNLGHKAGDELIKTLSDILRHSVRRSDTVARFSSNEFVVILNRTKDLDIVCQVAETIISHLSEEVAVEKNTVKVAISIGMAMYPADGDIAVELLRTADELMFRAKESGGNCYKSR